MNATMDKFPSSQRKRRRSYVPGDPRHYCVFPGCELSFSRLEHLKRHFKIHETAERPQCQYCNRSFARQDILTRHLRRKHMHPEGLLPSSSRSSATPGESESSNIATALGSNMAANLSSNSTSVSVHSAVHAPVMHQQPISQPSVSVGLSLQSHVHGTPPRAMTSVNAKGGSTAGNTNNIGSNNKHTSPQNVATAGSASAVETTSSTAVVGAVPGATSKSASKSASASSSKSSSNIFDVLNSIELKEDAVPMQDQDSRFFSATSAVLNDLESPLQNTENLWSSNQALSHLKNEDFLDWLFNQSNMTLENGTGYSSDDGNSESAIMMAGRNEASPDFDSRMSNLSNTSDYATDFCTPETCEKLKSIILPGGNLSSDTLDRILTPENVTHAVSRYWLLHNRWPMLHKPTFRVNECPPHLLMSMITLAMFIGGDPDGIRFSTEVHETHRYSIYMLPQFSMPTLWIFQALLLSEIFELLASTEKQHDLASRFHSVMISTMRKAGPMDSDFFHNFSKDQIRTEEDALDYEWKTFIDQEARRRVAFFAFVLDTQHSTFFNQPASMFISDMNLRLPCEEEVWEASDAVSWKELKKINPSPPLFTKVIGSFLKLEFDPRVQLSPWSMMIVLHGLISAGWNMRLKERISMEPVSTTGAATTVASTSSTDLPVRTSTPSQAETWTHIISKAYHFWLRHYKYTFISSGRLSHNHPYVLGCLATYETAHIFMNCPLERFMQFLEFVAMNTSASARGQGSVEVNAQVKQCAVSISNWINRATVLSDLSHALDLIDMFLLTGQPYDIRTETAFHKPWCLYLAAITVWIYQYFVMSLPADREPGLATIPTYSATQFIGKVRAQNNVAINGPRSKLSGDFLVTTQKRLVYCEANSLLLEVLKLLEGTKWGVLRRKLEVIRIMLE